MKTYQYDYYVIDIPEDVYPMPLPSDGISDGGESYTDDELSIIESEIKENRANLAIDIARENAKLYAMPCLWYVISDNGNQVKVCRKRHYRVR